MTNVLNVGRETKTESKRKVSRPKSVVSACRSLKTANEPGKQPPWLPTEGQRGFKKKEKKKIRFRCREENCH